MLHATDVLIDLKPVGGLRLVERSAVVVWIGVAIEIPRRIDKGVHRVGFAFGWTAALRTRRVSEFRNRRERRLPLAGQRDVFGQAHGELIVGNTDSSVLLA